MSGISVILTGGTISRVGSKRENLLNNNYIYGFLKDARLRFDVEIVDLCAMDSEDLVLQDSAFLMNAIRNAKYDRILITCGTDMMREIAQSVKKLVKNKFILFTGAMTPLRHAHSDAQYHLASSLTYLQTMQKKGVWICMHGRLFQPKWVEKDVENKHFIQK